MKNKIYYRNTKNITYKLELIIKKIKSIVV